MGVDGMRTAEILVVGSLLFGLGIRSARQSAGRGGGGEYEYEYEYEHVMTRIHNPRAHFLHSPFTVHRSPCSWPYPYPYPDTLHYSSLVTRIRIRIRRGWSRGRKCGPLALRIQSRVPSRDNVICKRQRAGPGGGGGGRKTTQGKARVRTSNLGPLFSVLHFPFAVLCPSFGFGLGNLDIYRSGNLEFVEERYQLSSAHLSSAQIENGSKGIEFPTPPIRPHSRPSRRAARRAGNGK